LAKHSETEQLEERKTKEEREGGRKGKKEEGNKQYISSTF
jgi:hypothetical protein